MRRPRTLSSARTTAALTFCVRCTVRNMVVAAAVAGTLEAYSFPRGRWAFPDPGETDASSAKSRPRLPALSRVEIGGDWSVIVSPVVASRCNPRSSRYWSHSEAVIPAECARRCLFHSTPGLSERCHDRHYSGGSATAAALR